MSHSVRPHRRQPTRLRHLWDFPGKSTGVGCHFLLHCLFRVLEKSLSNQEEQEGIKKIIRHKRFLNLYLHLHSLQGLWLSYKDEDPTRWLSWYCGCRTKISIRNSKEGEKYFKSKDKKWIKGIWCLNIYLL